MAMCLCHMWIRLFLFPSFFCIVDADWKLADWLTYFLADRPADQLTDHSFDLLTG